MGEKKWKRLLLSAAAAAAGAGALGKMWQDQKKRDFRRLSAVRDAVMKNRDYGSRQAFLIGGGLASMAAALYLIRDCRFPADHITIYEEKAALGGSNKAFGAPEQGFWCLGERVLDQELWGNLWELLDAVPSLNRPGSSVSQEILGFSKAHPVQKGLRIVNRKGQIREKGFPGFSMSDRAALAKLLLSDEKRLDRLSVQDWFADSPHLFETAFWYMCQSYFGLRRWSSLQEFRRRVRQLVPVWKRMGRLDGLIRTPFNQYDSMIRPLESWLGSAGVRFELNCRIQDLEFSPGPGIRVQALNLERRDGQRERIALNPGDICILTNGSMTEGISLGSLDQAAFDGQRQPEGARLWSQASAQKPGLGNPKAFFARPEETSWMSFTATCQGGQIFRLLENLGGIVPGSGGRLFFEDSGWGMTCVLPLQPHFPGQAMDETVFWVSGIYPGARGNYVKKPMWECTGRELLEELLGHLQVPRDRREALLDTARNVIPCFMPWGAAQLEPRQAGDRPLVVPAGAMNFAMVGQFVEIPREPVMTEEYAVRSARTAVYTLMDVRRPVFAAKAWKARPLSLLKALVQTWG